MLDTHLLMWAAGEPDRLEATVRTLLADPTNRLLISAASLWEVTIKRALGRTDFEVDPHRLRRDRLLMAQSTVEGVMLLTSDAVVARDPGPIQLV